MNQDQQNRSVRRFNGLAILAAMLREVDPKFREQLLAKISAKEPVLVRLLDKMDVLYIDVLRVTDQSMPRLLSRIPEQTLMLAWRLSANPVRQKLLAGMSARRAEDFLAAVKAAKPVPKVQVYHAQQAIAKILRDALSTGQIHLESRRPLKEMMSSLSIKKQLRMRAKNKGRA